MLAIALFTCGFDLAVMEERAPARLVAAAPSPQSPAACSNAAVRDPSRRIRRRFYSRPTRRFGQDPIIKQINRKRTHVTLARIRAQ